MKDCKISNIETKIKTTIYQTNDYNEIKEIQSNREFIFDKKAKEIMENMKLFGYDPSHPIALTKDYYCYDGWRRFNVARMLNIPVLFVLNKKLSYKENPNQVHNWMILLTYVIVDLKIFF